MRVPADAPRQLNTRSTVTPHGGTIRQVNGMRCNAVNCSDHCAKTGADQSCMYVLYL